MKYTIDKKLLKLWEDKDVLRTTELAAILGCSYDHIEDALVGKNAIPSYKEKRIRYYKMSDIKNFIQTYEHNEKMKHKRGRRPNTIKNGWYISSRLSQKALNTFSPQNQKMKLLEEMAELQDAILKEQQGRDTKKHVQEEIADVRIMLDQMRMLFGPEGVDKFVKEKEERIQRLIAERNTNQDDEPKGESINPITAKQTTIDFENVQ